MELKEYFPGIGAYAPKKFLKLTSFSYIEEKDTSLINPVWRPYDDMVDMRRRLRRMELNSEEYGGDIIEYLLEFNKSVTFKLESYLYHMAYDICINLLNADDCYITCMYYYMPWVMIWDQIEGIKTKMESFKDVEHGLGALIVCGNSHFAIDISYDDMTKLYNLVKPETIF